MQPTGCADYVDTRTQPQVICVAENDLRVEISGLEFFEANSFNGSGRPDGHEYGRLNRPAPRRQHTRPCLTLLPINLKAQCPGHKNKYRTNCRGGPPWPPLC